MCFDAIAKIVSERTGCEVFAVKPESKFSELGIDSLDTVELFMNLEDERGLFMFTFNRKINYYETDKMGITHHSNYVRFMEEARMAYLTAIGYGMAKLEADGITSPVVSVECNYKHISTFDDELKIDVFLQKYSGVKLVLSYIMTNASTGSTVLTAKSTHCFVDGKGNPIAVKKHFVDFDKVLRQLAEQDKQYLD